MPHSEPLETEFSDSTKDLPVNIKRAVSEIEKKAAANIAKSLGLSEDAVGIYVRGDEMEIYARIPDAGWNENKRKELMEGLGKIAPLAAVAQFKDEAAIAKQVHAKLTEITAGVAEFDSKLLSWPGFNPEIAKKKYSVNTFALDAVGNSAFGITFSLTVPMTDKDLPEEAMAKITDGINKRLPEIRDILKDRMIKYLTAKMTAEGKTADQIKAEVASASEKMSKLQITLNTENYSVNVTIRSPEQAEALKKNNNQTYPDPDNGNDLRKSNPLHELTHTYSPENPNPQLHKTLARAFLFNKKEENSKKPATPVDFFPLVAGRQDIQAAIGKQLWYVAQQKPEKAPIIKELLDSAIFKEHTSYLAKDSKDQVVSPNVTLVRGHQDVFKVRLDLAPEKIQELIPSLAGETVPQLATTTAATDAAVADQILKSASAPAAGIADPKQPLGAPVMPTVQVGATAKKGDPNSPEALAAVLKKVIDQNQPAAGAVRG